LSQVLDFVGLDYYHPANEVHHAIIMRRTTELAVRSEGTETPAYGAEMGVGFPPFFAPLDDNDSLYTLMSALGHGLRGFNLYMAVDRDRWIGAPIDPHGMPRPLADRYRALIEALERLQFHTLTRRAPVRLVVPRVLRRLARAMHAFGPVTPALFNVLGAGFESSCLEDDLGTGEIAAVAADKFLRAFERALIARGVPFAYAGGDSFAASTQGAKWLVCATAGGVKPELFDRMTSARAAGVVVTIGPKVPALDGHMRPLEAPFDVSQIEVEPLEDAARVDALVAKRIEELKLPTYPVDPENVFVTVHEDAAGAPRVVMVMNPGTQSVTCSVAVPAVRTMQDAIVHGPHAGQRIGRDAGAFRVEVPGRTVRMFEVIE
jgi:beta-galactosidase